MGYRVMVGVGGFGEGHDAGINHGCVVGLLGVGGVLTLVTWPGVPATTALSYQSPQAKRGGRACPMLKQSNAPVVTARGIALLLCCHFSVGGNGTTLLNGAARWGCSFPPRAALRDMFCGGPKSEPFGTFTRSFHGHATFLEAITGFEPVCATLQVACWPLAHIAGLGRWIPHQHFLPPRLGVLHGHPLIADQAAGVGPVLASYRGPKAFYGY